MVPNAVEGIDVLTCENRIELEICREVLLPYYNNTRMPMSQQETLSTIYPTHLLQR